jgi:hypothetical protein
VTSTLAIAGALALSFAATAAATPARAADPAAAAKPAPPATAPVVDGAPAAAQAKYSPAAPPAAAAPETVAPAPETVPAPPVAAPPAAAPPAAEPPPPAPPPPSESRLDIRDTVANPGYLPGYRTQQSLSMSPYAPTVGALPGGITPGYGAPMPPGQWTFRFNGFFTASLQGSLNRRRSTTEGQGGPIFHAPPQTLDEYGSFVGTSTMPGQWVALNFSYGNPVVSANISINTWNPSDPSTYYQIGSQYFINNANLGFDIPAFGNLKMRSTVGYFYNYYGNLAQYGPGMYTQTIIGSPRGVGESVAGVYHLTADLTLLFEDGLMGARTTKVPDGVVPNGGNGSASPIFPAAFIHHLHVGLLRSGDPTLKVQLHWMTNWAADDRVQQPHDNPVTRYVNEAYVRDGRLDVLGFDAMAQHRTWGYLGVVGSFTRGDNASTLKGLQTFGGDSGQTLSERWLGQSTAGTGKLFAAGLNYTFSLGRILSAPQPFSNERPDLIVNAGFVIAYTLVHPLALVGTTTPGPIADDVNLFDRRLRYKFGADALYSFKSWMAAGLRADRVVPNSKDAGETFYVVAPRLVFKRSWNSREAITLLYAKWFYGPRSHSEFSSVVPSDLGLDDQLIALNVNLWW